MAHIAMNPYHQEKHSLAASRVSLNIAADQATRVAAVV